MHTRNFPAKRDARRRRALARGSNSDRATEWMAAFVLLKTMRNLVDDARSVRSKKFRGMRRQAA